jgi:hypothetical protein
MTLDGINKVYLGSEEVSKIYVGETLIWPIITLPSPVITAITDGTSIVITWGLVEEADAIVIQYTSTGEYGIGDEVNASILSHTISGLTAGVEYTFRAFFKVGTSISAYSNEVSATPAEAQPGRILFYSTTSTDNIYALDLNAWEADPTTSPVIIDTKASAGYRNVAVDQDTGDLYVAASTDGCIYKLTYNGGSRLSSGSYTRSVFDDTDMETAFAVAIGVTGGEKHLFYGKTVTSGNRIFMRPLAGGTRTVLLTGSTTSRRGHVFRSDGLFSAVAGSGGDIIRHAIPANTQTTPASGGNTVSSVGCIGDTIYYNISSTSIRSFRIGQSTTLDVITATEGLSGVVWGIEGRNGRDLYVAEGDTGGIYRYDAITKTRTTLTAATNPRGVALYDPEGTNDTQQIPANPSMWLDASDASTLTLVSGGVSEWRDKSGKGNHATQSDPALRPVVTAGAMNGLPAIDFAAHRLLLPALGLTNHTVFIVTKHTLNTTDALNHFFECGRAGLGTRATGTEFSVSVSPAAGVLPFVVTPFKNGQSNLFTIFRTGDAQPTLRLQGVNVATSGSTNRFWSAGTSRIGSAAFTGQVAEVLIYDRVLGASERSDVESYLMNKWGVTL